MAEARGGGRNIRPQFCPTSCGFACKAVTPAPFDAHRGVNWCQGAEFVQLRALGNRFGPNSERPTSGLGAHFSNQGPERASPPDIPNLEPRCGRSGPRSREGCYSYAGQTLAQSGPNLADIGPFSANEWPTFGQTWGRIRAESISRGD